MTPVDGAGVCARLSRVRLCVVAGEAAASHLQYVRYLLVRTLNPKPSQPQALPSSFPCQTCAGRQRLRPLREKAERQAGKQAVRKGRLGRVSKCIVATGQTSQDACSWPASPWAPVSFLSLLSFSLFSLFSLLPLLPLVPPFSLYSSLPPSLPPSLPSLSSRFLSSPCFSV